MKSVINEFRKAGYHTVTFNASNFSSGTYFYMFETEGGNNVMTKKMLLLLKSWKKTRKKVQNM